MILTSSDRQEVIQLLQRFRDAAQDGIIFIQNPENSDEACLGKLIMVAIALEQLAKEPE